MVDKLIVMMVELRAEIMVAKKVTAITEMKETTMEK